MSSNDPSGFTSFADYLGLNDEAGQSMLQKTMASQAGRPEDIQKLSEQNYAASGRLGKDDALYESTKSGVQSGLMAYGTFLTKMSDPTQRQQLIEDAYGGKGAASWLDSALTGSAGGGAMGRDLAQKQSDLSDLRARTGALGGRADAHRGQAQTDAANYATSAAASEAQRNQAKADQAASAKAKAEMLAFYSDPNVREKRDAFYGSGAAQADGRANSGEAWFTNYAKNQTAGWVNGRRVDANHAVGGHRIDGQYMKDGQVDWVGLNNDRNRRSAAYDAQSKAVSARGW